eukprot:CAMPEP_0114656864 /NCGR_PEP_ID=MMETSP0191-20121206/13007_1 /TAXON_ID=126664 /ORGANISM="Sorites sp." /LENGTH=156 /DNA_ID=CAMNT_0001874979 /DNA_START=52 /DNA_END=522 /DNA_ORIENTATION=+
MLMVKVLSLLIPVLAEHVEQACHGETCEEGSALMQLNRQKEMDEIPWWVIKHLAGGDDSPDSPDSPEHPTTTTTTTSTTTTAPMTDMDKAMIPMDKGYTMEDCTKVFTSQSPPSRKDLVGCLDKLQDAYKKGSVKKAPKGVPPEIWGAIVEGQPFW